MNKAGVVGFARMRALPNGAVGALLRPLQAQKVSRSVERILVARCCRLSPMHAYMAVTLGL